jgi:hypothetical protein
MSDYLASAQASVNTPTHTGTLNSGRAVLRDALNDLLAIRSLLCPTPPQAGEARSAPADTTPRGVARDIESLAETLRDHTRNILRELSD